MTQAFRREIGETDRLLALSDGVIAIAITLLILDISVPTVPADSAGEVLPGLVADQWHEFFGYVLSFLVIGLYWVLHRRIFVHIERHDRGVLWLNLLFLLLVAAVPYATSVFTTYPDRFGVVFYASVLALTGFSFVALWGYASRRQLVEDGLTSRSVRIQAARLLVSPLVFAGSILVALENPMVAVGVWVLLLPLNALFESRLVASLEASPADPGTQPR